MTTPSYLLNRTINPYLTVFANRVLTPFVKTEDIVLQDIPGLAFNLTSGRSYRLRAELYLNAHPDGGIRLALAGNLLTTALIYQTNVIAMADDISALVVAKRLTAFGDSGALIAAGAPEYFATILGEIDVDQGGSISLQFAQQDVKDESSVLTGSIFAIEDIGSFI